MTAERRWAESLFESSPAEDAKILWEPDDRPLYARSVEEVAAYERSLTGLSWFAATPHTARLTRESFAHALMAMRFPLRGPALDRPAGTYR